MKSAQSKIILPSALRKSFDADWEKYRILYFFAPCGVGKTVAAHELLRTKTHCVSEYSAFSSGFCLEAECPACDTVLIDDFQALDSTADRQTLCRWVNENSDKHFVFLSRGILPGWLMPYRFTGLLTTIDAQSLLLDLPCVQALLDAADAKADASAARSILQDSGGYPLLIATICRRMSGGAAYTQTLLDESVRELFHYVEEAVYRRFSPPMRFLLVALTPFDEFDSELATLVSGDSHVNELLNELLHKTTMLQENSVRKYRFWPIFRDFLLWEMKQDCTLEQQNNIYRRAGLYYELHDDYAHALDCYTKSGDHEKISELLVKNAERQVGAAHYYDMEQYYLALPREDILRSPALMSGMSMLMAMCADYDASDAWYNELLAYAARLKKTDANYKSARAKLTYLDIALPQRGIKDMKGLMLTAFHALTDADFKMQEISVTSLLPSIMNGGKDFCEWSKSDDLLYATMRIPVEAVLGRGGVALADCGICESKFEKGEDVSSRALALISRVSDIQRRGTPDTLFACIGLLARIQLAHGKADAAMEALDNLQESLIETEQTRFLPNLEAMRCRIWLRTGETEKAAQWLSESAPPGVPRFRALWRYRYFTKAMVQIAGGAPVDALVTLAPMLPYCERCGRTMDGLYIHLLTAICRFRLKDSTWKQELDAALDTAQEYRFIMPIAQFGAAVLPLLDECGQGRDSTYFAQLMSAVREQTINYPDFLRPAATALEPLTPAELQVLKLLCANRSNGEICDILGVKLSTVKTQVFSIFQKLQIKRRSEAKDAAQRLHLLDNTILK